MLFTFDGCTMFIKDLDLKLAAPASTIVGVMDVRFCQTVNSQTKPPADGSIGTADLSTSTICSGSIPPKPEP